MKNLLRTVLIAVGMLLIIVALVCMGLDMIASLEAHGILSAATVADMATLLSPETLTRLCPGHSSLCQETINRLQPLYAWVIPGVAGVLLIWLSTLGRAK